MLLYFFDEGISRVASHYLLLQRGLLFFLGELMCCETINHQHEGNSWEIVGVTADVRVCLGVEHACVECDCVRECICVECASPVVSIACISLIVCVCALVLGTEICRVIVRDSYMSSVSA